MGNVRSAIDRSDAEISHESRRLPAQLGLFLSFAIVVPLITIVGTQIWLRSAYSTDVFHLQGFLAQYGHGIYRYRILGRDLLIAIYHLLLRHGHETPLAVPADPLATRLFYTAYVLLNGACLFLTNFLLLVILWSWRHGISDLRCAGYLFCWLVLALSSYTVTPYDQLAYVFLLLALVASTWRPAWITYGVVGVAAILGALTRETQFLASPALWSIAIFTARAVRRRFAALGIIHIVLFAACYVALRVFVPGPPSVAQGLSFGGGRVAPIALLVMAAIVWMGMALFSREYAGYKAGLVFLALASPYLVTVLLSGAFWELRLVVPIVLCQLFVYTHISKHRIIATQLP